MILGIETSCDETSVALLDRDGRVRSNLTASQIERHRPFGGVVPEIASREHLQHLFPLIRRAVSDGGAELSGIEWVAVTSGPGLIGALLVGVAGAQGLAWGLGIPVVAVNHLEGHIFSPYLNLEGPATPLPARLLSIVLSGGHSSIYDVRKNEAGAAMVEMINRTRDDAIGETFDKVAKFIGLPYPGGPQIERLARRGTADPKRFPFSLPQFKEATSDFSFSGIKASAIRIARERKIAASGEREMADFCAAFQNGLFEQVFSRLDMVWSRARATAPEPTEIVLAGGVAANGVLRERIRRWADDRGVVARLADQRYCTDNAAMIAFAALQTGRPADPRRVIARSRMQPGSPVPELRGS
jgi:N6-L-threonylcarbamoyladenine synthase